MTNLYGKLVGTTTKEYERTITALHSHQQLINRFGDAMEPFGVTPHLRAKDDGGVNLVAMLMRGDDYKAVLASMRAKGYQIGEAIKMPQQFNDGFVIWSAPVRGASLEFSILFYIPADLA